MSSVWLRTIGLLVLSNVFMTFAWYGHLKTLRDRPLWIAIAVSWGIAFFEYCLQVPANRAGFGTFNLGQLKVMQEVITMIVFMVFAVLYMRRPFSMDLVWATLCLCGAAYFVFRGGTGDGAAH
ncbi:DMT family protein [Sandaracinus amylolyticus]|uniref:DMT family protein n=1 Tax=Sandaracinus amylolyticus TaxID=927083 RepID=UPI001F333C37|nr:DMT family protein [Sandaracinus amylolyticus]UJR78896.1 Transmembrane signal peptide protein [Sandaracinus amylolyticus]